MAKLDYDVIEESRLFYDKYGECWMSFCIPREADVGALGATLWQSYVKYLESLNTKPDAVQEALCPV